MLALDKRGRDYGSECWCWGRKNDPMKRGSVNARIGGDGGGGEGGGDDNDSDQLKGRRGKGKGARKQGREKLREINNVD